MAIGTNNLDRAIEERIRKGPKQSLRDSFNKTNLDTQNPEPEGGPINDPVIVVDGMTAGSGFEQVYSAQNPYLQRFLVLLVLLVVQVLLCLPLAVFHLV